MERPTLCVHCVKENITYSVQGKKFTEINAKNVMMIQ